MATLTDAKLNSKVEITGISFSLGSYSISSRDKVSSIVDSSRLKDETDKVVLGLGINRTSVAAKGEDVITNAALAIIKLIVSYNVDTSKVSNVVIATETPHDISQSMANPVLKLTNKLIDKLNNNGYNIKHLNPEIGMHVQSACTSAGSAISSYAINGLSGYAIIVATDNAEYKLGTAADETGGFGSVAVLLEPYEKGKKGIVLLDKIGHYSDEVPDFIKVIFDDNYSSSGLSLVARYPIVFGKFSEEAYSLAIFEALKRISENTGIPINNRKMLESYDLISHLPYPKIPEKLLAYLIRHLSRTDSSLKEDLSVDLGILNSSGTMLKESFLPGFDSLEDEFKFIIKFESLYNNAVGLSSEIKGRMSERKNEMDSFLNAGNTKDEVKSIIWEIENISSEFESNTDILELLGNCKESFLMLLESDKIGEKDIENAFKPIMDVINEFEKEDNVYNKSIRSSKIFKQIKEELHIEEAVKLSKEIGNIYTGSILIGLVSYLTNVKKPKNNLLLTFYGSGFESYVIEAIPNIDENFISLLDRNVENEFARQRIIDGETYIKIRKNAYDDAKIPLSRDNIFRVDFINEGEFLDEIKKYKN
ncbi:hypothetical protein [Candidatus Mancarchaeum acidiphilum]|nr:hypothetical protein [Candidatus Mancarchaeum acidiphilum]